MSHLMLDGNSAALRSYEAYQGDVYEPTEHQIETFILNWIEATHKRLGCGFIIEAFNEASDSTVTALNQAFRSGNAIELRAAMRDLIDEYWLPLAERASDEHDYSERDYE